MRAGSWLIAVSAVGVLAVGVVAAEGQRRSSTGAHAAPGAIAATVTWVSDGDTLRARAADGTDLGRVRLLGIDAPELAHDGRSAQCWSEQARAALGALTPVGAAITLVPDLGQADRDVYGRLLRYVEIGGDDVSDQLLAAGAARIKKAVVVADVPASRVWTDGNDPSEFGYDGPALTDLHGYREDDPFPPPGQAALPSDGAVARLATQQRRHAAEQAAGYDSPTTGPVLGR